MRLVITHLGEGFPVELAEGRHSVGGGAQDAVRLAPLPPACVTLAVEPGQLVLEARQPVHVDGVAFPAGVPRLLLPDETLELPEGVCVRWEAAPAPPPPSPGTASLFRALLVEAGAPGLEAPGLTCVSGPDLGRTFPLPEAVAEVGRAAEVEVRLRDRTVSRRHVRLLRDAEGFLVEDLGSPNGVYLDGRRVRGCAPLHDGEVLEVGHTLLRFRAPGLAPARPSRKAEGPRPRSGVDWALLASGATLALLGVLVSFALLP